MELKLSSKKHKDPLNTYKSVHEPAKNGDVKSLESMVKEGASVNEIDSSIYKFTPLHWACQAGSLECVHWLLWHGADPSVSSTKGWTPLHVASICGSHACVQALINNKVNVNARDVRGNTAGHVAATHGHNTLLSTLLRAGIDANEKNKRRWTPVHCSSFHGRLACLQTLIKWGGRVDETDENGDNAVHLAAMGGSLNCLKFLLGELKNSSPASFSFSSGWLNERNNDGETPKMVAGRYFKDEVVEYIEQLEWEYDHPEEAQSLAFPAHVAAYTGDVEQLKLLVENNIVGVNERDNSGSTIAHKAAGQGNLEILEWLVDFGADLALKNHAGETPKDVARRFSRFAAVKMLGGMTNGEDDDDEEAPEKVLPIRRDARAEALRRLEEVQAKLDIAKSNYVQLGGRVDDVTSDHDRDAMAGHLEELRRDLEEEREARLALEETVEDYKEEIIRLTCELQQVIREKEEATEQMETDARRKPSRSLDKIKKKFSS